MKKGKNIDDLMRECQKAHTFRRSKDKEYYCLLGHNHCEYQGQHYVVVGEKTPQFYLECKRKI